MLGEIVDSPASSCSARTITVFEPDCQTIYPAGALKEREGRGERGRDRERDRERGRDIERERDRERERGRERERERGRERSCKMLL